MTDVATVIDNYITTCDEAGPERRRRLVAQTFGRSHPTAACTR